MRIGQKVVCINDKNKPVFGVGNPITYIDIIPNWIKEGTTYVIREVVLGANAKGEEGEIGLLLLGINNPVCEIPCKFYGHEVCFNSERFRPIEEKTDKVTLYEDNKINA